MKCKKGFESQLNLRLFFSDSFLFTIQGFKLWQWFLPTLQYNLY